MRHSIWRACRSAMVVGLPALFCCVVLASMSLASPELAHARYNDVADSYPATQELSAYGYVMTGSDVPEGSYSITATSNSYMCKFTNVTLTSAQGQLWVTFSMSEAYNALFLGTAEEAAAQTNEEGTDYSAYYVSEPLEGYVARQFSIPIAALNKRTTIATYSGGSKGTEGGMWYTREVVFNSSSEVDSAAAGNQAGPGAGADDGGTQHPLKVVVDDPSAGAQATSGFDVAEDGALVEAAVAGGTLRTLALQYGTYSMSSPDGSSTTTVEGYGASLDTLLASAGVGPEDQRRIESVDFVIPNHDTVSFSWSDLVGLSGSAGRGGIMVASLSRVRELNGVEVGGGDGQAQPLDDTRFRLLYQGSLPSDPLDLCCISSIVVHMGEPEEKQEDIADPELSIRIDYVPVPYGNEAFLSAVPSNKVGASRFGYTWEISTDGGKTWTTHSDDSVQTLRVKTADPPDGHIGHMYRVILETDLKNPDGSTRVATSDPVKIVEKVASRVAVYCDYNPAGGTMDFTTRLYNADGIDTGELTYTWEADTGNGWEVIPGAPNAPSWSMPDPYMDDSTNGTYCFQPRFRVRVTFPDGRTEVSNELNGQPLTVRVGEDSGAPEAVCVIEDGILTRPEKAGEIASAETADLPKVRISKPQAGKGSMTVKWKKLSKKKLKKIKKVQVQYCLKKSFKSGVKSKYANVKKASVKIRKLKSKKKYYVRIRAYTKSGDAVHVSRWSAVKAVMVK